MLIKFTKMQGLGNDFVVIDLISQRLLLNQHQIQRIANRNYGLGCDQLLLVEPPANPDSDFFYRIYNADGTEAQQCGNGARCFGKFVQDMGLANKNNIVVDTVNGIIQIKKTDNGLFAVNMGTPNFNLAAIPFNTSYQANIYPLKVENEITQVSVVSMGNPHAVIKVNSSIADAPVSTLGAKIATHEKFPQGVNVGFMQIVDRSNIKLRVYERGAGETLACGSGACAAVAVARNRGLVDKDVTVSLTGGDLKITWPGNNEDLWMQGPAVTVFNGTFRV